MLGPGVTGELPTQAISVVRLWTEPRSDTSRLPKVILKVTEVTETVRQGKDSVTYLCRLLRAAH